MLFITGLGRTSLGQGDLDASLLGIVYLFGSEFLGVQASIGWAMDYYASSYPLSFWNFGSTLENFYIASVGHGLATSPGAYLQANFGNTGPAAAIIACLIGLVLFRLSVRWLGLVAYLIIAINFQHFLRHGLDVFIVKIISQMVIAVLIVIIVNTFKRSGMHHLVQPPAHIQ